LRAEGDAFEVFLPGVTCRGSSMRFALACADEGEPWPIGIENAGMAASRNTFATPEGFSFYEAAPLDGGQWLVVDQQGTLTFLDAQRRVVAEAMPAIMSRRFGALVGQAPMSSLRDALRRQKAPTCCTWPASWAPRWYRKRRRLPCLAS
jgi:hypothetical protein